MCLLASVLNAAATVQTIPLVKDKTIPRVTTEDISFDLPAAPAGKQVRLAMLARVNYSSNCANNPAMIVIVNGRQVVGADLLNKTLEYNDKNGRDVFWAVPKGTQWFLFSWPDYSAEAVWAYDNPYAVEPGVDPFTFVFDITGYVKPGKNTIAIQHIEITKENHSLALRDVKIEIGDPLPSRGVPVVTPAPTGPVPGYAPKGRRWITMNVKLGAGGTIRFGAAGRSFDAVTRTSAPNSQWVESFGGGWRTIRRGRTAKARWAGPDYSVHRTVTVNDDHIKIFDTFTNTGKNLVGILYENRVIFQEKPRDVKLGGRPAYSKFQREAGGTNPTALARWDDLAVGLAAEDDIFRAHVGEFSNENAFGIGDHELGLAPGASHTLEWSIYPVPKGDYWDFLNALRRNWDANFTIPGPSSFVAWSTKAPGVDFIRNWQARRKMAFVCSFDAMFDLGNTPTGKAAMGTAIPLAKIFCAETKTWLKQLHEAAPGTKGLMYMNNSLCTEPGAAEKYADSRLLDSNRVQMSVAAGSPQGITMAPLFISTTENSYGRAMMETVKYIIEDLGADGLYHDVFNGNYDYGAHAFDTTWDGCTVAIDPKTHAVTGKMSSLALLQRDWHVELVKYLRERGKLITANGACETRTIMQLKIPIFIETGMSYSTVIDNHLGSPWAYGNHGPADQSRDMFYNAAHSLRRILEYGGILQLPTWYQEPDSLTFLALLYPFTPIELYPGVIIGEERIITSRSGRFGWADGSPAETYVFDGNGRRVVKGNVKTVKENGRGLTEIRMPSDHFAILVKKGGK